MSLAELRRMFQAERARFGRSFPQIRRAGLVVVGRPPRLPRRAMGFSETSPRTPLVGLYRDALSLSRANVLGIIRHELGHLAAPRGGEQRADDVAEAVTGRKIRYDRRLIQTVGKGRYPRPRNIHR